MWRQYFGIQKTGLGGNRPSKRPNEDPQVGIHLADPRSISAAAVGWTRTSRRYALVCARIAIFIRSWPLFGRVLNGAAFSIRVGDSMWSAKSAVRISRSRHSAPRPQFGL
jgi:hypothetical protein